MSLVRFQLCGTYLRYKWYLHKLHHFYRPQTKFGARWYFYTCPSVILFTGRWCFLEGCHEGGHERKGPWKKGGHERDCHEGEFHERRYHEVGFHERGCHEGRFYERMVPWKEGSLKGGAVQESPFWSTSGHYSSYWNAFLLWEFSVDDMMANSINPFTSKILNAEIFHATETNLPLKKQNWNLINIPFATNNIHLVLSLLKEILVLGVLALVDDRGPIERLDHPLDAVGADVGNVVEDEVPGVGGESTGELQHHLQVVNLKTISKNTMKFWLMKNVRKKLWIFFTFDIHSNHPMNEPMNIWIYFKFQS